MAFYFAMLFDRCSQNPIAIEFGAAAATSAASMMPPTQQYYARKIFYHIYVIGIINETLSNKIPEKQS